jgi:hypothetical protein
VLTVGSVLEIQIPWTGIATVGFDRRPCPCKWYLSLKSTTYITRFCVHVCYPCEWYLSFRLLYALRTFTRGRCDGILPLYSPNGVNQYWDRNVIRNDPRRILHAFIAYSRKVAVVSPHYTLPPNEIEGYIISHVSYFLLHLSLTNIF